ncbi:Glycosyl hydrolase family 26 [Modestobacter sp. DSM 44400]|nr:Glycosyl hydrolase family 26 [Modestobacter sp. DSM 44400]
MPPTGARVVDRRDGVRGAPGQQGHGGLVFLLVAATALIALIAYVVLAAAPAGRPRTATPMGPTAAQPAPVAPTVTAPPTGTAPRADTPVREPVMGISVPTTDDLDRFIAATGTHPEVVDVFEGWSLDRPLERGIADTVAARGARLSITWEPWDSTGSHTAQPDYSLASIADGDHDAYIDMFAESIQRYAHPVTIRLMHEMNGNWYPWGSGVNGNQPGQFVLAWQHVHDRFAALGVSNVTWMWAPNGVFRGSASLAGLYPGDAYVDLVGMSNYNWGDQHHDYSTTVWQSFDSLFDPSIAALQALTAKPIWIAETGSSNSGGSKAQWLADTFAELQHRPDVAGVVWFDHVDDARNIDWRIETEAAAIAAWHQAFVSRHILPTTRRVAE